MISGEWNERDSLDEMIGNARKSLEKVFKEADLAKCKVDEPENMVKDAEGCVAMLFCVKH